MPNLAMELRHLEKADLHIALARDRIARVKELLETSGGRLKELTEELLATLEQGLTIYERHHSLIVDAIEDCRGFGPRESRHNGHSRQAAASSRAVSPAPGADA